MKTITRLRRLRAHETMRHMAREHELVCANLVYPLFVHPGIEPRIPVSTMPGVSQLSLEAFEQDLEELVALGVPSILLFGLANNKDNQGSEAFAEFGIVQQAIRIAKKRFPSLYLMSDVCLCAYTSHGHCGVVIDGKVHNDASVELLTRVALSHAEAGVDLVAPSDMMDGRVHAIRGALDKAGYQDLPIMSYAAKFASAFYGPFREAASCAPQFGDRRSYQMDPANTSEAHREILADKDEGADIIVIKPALAYADLIYQARQLTKMPIAAYHVSGEYAMLKAAAKAGYLDEKQAVLESLLCSKRAGASLLITYHALDVARWLQEA